MKVSLALASLRSFCGMVDRRSRPEGAHQGSVYADGLLVLLFRDHRRCIFVSCILVSCILYLVCLSDK